MTNPKQATTTKAGRFYTWDNGKYASVTTIIGNGIPKQKILTSWAAKMVATEAAKMIFGGTTLAALKRVFGDKEALIKHLKGSPYAYRDKKGDIGSKVHAWVEAYTLGQPLPEAALEIKGYLEGFKQFLEDYRPEFIATEATVYSVQWGYAGTLDWIAWLWMPTDEVDEDGRPIFERKLLLGDWKTSGGVYGDYALQMNAYGHADFIGLPGGVEAPLPEVEGAVIVHLEPNGHYSLWDCRFDLHVFECFRKTVDHAEWLPELDSFVKELPAIKHKEAA